MFPNDSVVKRITLEPAVLFGAGRALLLQIAHPNVAAGVDDHSDFKRDPFKRLSGTLEATYSVVVGTEELAEGIGRRIQGIHDFITGPTYRANDPANLLWVHATLIETSLDCYKTYVGPVSARDTEEFYEQSMVVAEVFGCPASAQPANWAEFRAYFDDTVSSLEVSNVGKDLGRYILRPNLPWKLRIPLAPPVALLRALTIETLPEPLLDQFGFRSNRRQRQRVRAFQRTVRTGSKLIPSRARRSLPSMYGKRMTRVATRHVAQWDARS